jgi:inner membrane protein
MDSLSHIALGSAVAVATMGRRTPIWKAALWGAICGTLPDLDVFIPHGDPISDMTQHRAHSHALFYLMLVSPLIAWVAVKVHHDQPQWRRWWLAVWLALWSHPLLDWMTVYGIRLGLPFTDRPFGLGTIFIIDPLFTLPMVVGGIAVLRMPNARGLRWNAAGLALSTAYLGWCLAIQQHVTSIAHNSLRNQVPGVQHLLVTPAPFNSVLWRVVAVSPEGYHEGFYSLLDREPRIAFQHFARGKDLYDTLRGNPHVEQINVFSRGFFKMTQDGSQVQISDLRMGQEPNYTFSFLIAQQQGDKIVPVQPEKMRWGVDMRRGMQWLWQRVQGL